MHKIELVPLSALRPAPYNPRHADAERLDLVELSLRKLGFLLPVAATQDGLILSGHQRCLVAGRMGAQRVPVLRLDIPERLHKSVNILFNRATNDIALTNTETDMRAALSRADIAAMAETLPDIPVGSPAFYPCMAAEARAVPPLARHNVFRFVRHAANVGRMLARLHVHLPIVATKDGTAINGVGRLEAAARKGRPYIDVVFVDAEKAAFARAMLNLLSMDFRFTGDNADFLRCGAFRRAMLKRTYFGTAFALPVDAHKKRLADFSLDDPEVFSKWKAACGDSVLDFGAGGGEEAAMLRERGITVTEFEPYPADGSVVNARAGRLSAMNFLAAVRKKVQFSAIFLSSVLNSVPFPEDREHILRIVAALCAPETTVFAAARSRKGSDWHWVTTGEPLNDRGSRACGFPLSAEEGTILGDVAFAPKVQKFYSLEEFRALFERHFGIVEAGDKGDMVTAKCRKPLLMWPRELAESLRFEFNLPYPDGKRMELATLALSAFSIRLGLDLEAV